MSVNLLCVSLPVSGVEDVCFYSSVHLPTRCVLYIRLCQISTQPPSWGLSKVQSFNWLCCVISDCTVPTYLLHHTHIHTFLYNKNAFVNMRYTFYLVVSLHFFHFISFYLLTAFYCPCVWWFHQHFHLFCSLFLGERFVIMLRRVLQITFIVITSLPILFPPSHTTLWVSMSTLLLYNFYTLDTDLILPPINNKIMISHLQYAPAGVAIREICAFCWRKYSHRSRLTKKQTLPRWQRTKKDGEREKERRGGRLPWIDSQ